MKNTARRILAALLMSSLILTSGISAIAATGAPAEATPAPAEATSNLPLEGKVSAELTDEVSSNEASNEVSSNEVSSNEVSSNEASNETSSTESPIVLGETRATVNEAPVEVVTIEENETPLAPKAESTLSPENETPLSPELPLEGKLSPKATDEVLSDEVSSNEESSNDLSPALTLTSTTYSGVTVEVNADEGVLPSDAYLFVAEIKSRAGKQTAEDALGNTDIEYDDYMLLDIQIRNGQAEEIEPDGNVRVNIMMDASKLPEDADESTLEIQHLAEDADGAVKAVETVADNGNMTDGSIGINGDNVEAEFKVGSFSFFTLTWKKFGNETNELTLTFEAYTLKEELINITQGNLSISDFSIDSLNTGQKILIKDFLAKKGLDKVTLGDKTYYFNYAKAKDINGEEGSYTLFDTLIYRPNHTHGGNGAVTLAAGNNEEQTKDYYSFRDDGQSDYEDRPIRLYYGETALGELHPVETIDSTSQGVKMHLFKFTDQFPKFYGVDGGNLYYKIFSSDIKGPDTEGSRGVQYDSNGTPYILEGEEDKKNYEFMAGNYIDWASLINKTGKFKGTSYKTIPTDFNFQTQKFARGQVTQGLLSAIIPAGEEFPLAHMDKEENGSMLSLGEWYNPDGTGSKQVTDARGAQEVNHLFRKDIFDEYGYYYYSCDENGVELESTTDRQTNFRVYEEVVSPRRNEGTAYDMANSAFYYQRGNFLPYNTIDPNKIVAVTKNSMGGDDLEPGDPLYGKLVHAPNEDFSIRTKWNERGKYYSFGMSVEATFAQREGGISEKGKPMMFEFNGDDDFWLYLDDVLVLDLGGNHDAQNGYIDFTDGCVYYTNNGSITNSSGYVTSNKSANQKTYENYKGEEKTLKYDGKTTIKDMFIKAYQSTYGYTQKEAEEAVNALDIWGTGDMANTFLAGTIHTMKIYYMEHGGTASNLRMMFNLPVVETSDLTVSKSFVENGKPKVVPDDFVATFEVYEMEAQGDGTFAPKKQNGVTLPPVGEVRLDPQTVKDGTFTAFTEDGRTRYEYKFKNLPLSKYYTVVEKIYRSDDGYLNTVMHKSSSNDGLQIENGLVNAGSIPTKKLNAASSATNANGALTGSTLPEEPTFTHVSEVVRMVSQGVSPKVMEVENHYQMTLTVEKHVHSQNTDDINTEYEFRLYLRKKDAEGNYVYYTEPLYEASQIGSKNPEDWGWDKLDSQTPYTVADGKNYYEFTLKDISVEGEGRITFGVPAGYEYVVEENVGGNFKVFRPFINMYKVYRDVDGNVVQGTNVVEWKEAYKPLPEDGISKKDGSFTPKSTPVDLLEDNKMNLLDDDARVVFINERQIVRTGVTLNSAPFMVMLAMVFFAAAGICVKYLRKKAEEEGELFD